MVLRVDGKSRIRAPDRTQPVPPLRPGFPERRTRDCRRNGTTPPFAAPDIAPGFVIGKCRRRHRSEEFPDFPKGIGARVLKGLGVHIVMDSHATHKTADDILGAVKRFRLRVNHNSIINFYFRKADISHRIPGVAPGPPVRQRCAPVTHNPYAAFGISHTKA